MKKKIFIQILLLLLILLLFLFIYQKYFKEIPERKNQTIKKENIKSENKLINITYESIDGAGRKYIIKLVPTILMQPLSHQVQKQLQLMKWFGLK